MAENPIADWDQYELIDSGDFEKLERYGMYVLRRPEPQAVWPKKLTTALWESKAHAWFKKVGSDQLSATGERGEWQCKPEMPDQWTITYPTASSMLRFRLGMTAFKHIGLFPEQTDNWKFIIDKVTCFKQEAPSVLNLFAYTGGATLAAASAGALVTHVDSVKPVVNWAKDNADASGFSNIRWIVEDALKYTWREVKRGKKYQGIVLDPPAYGRGPAGEKWVLGEQINTLLDACSQLLVEDGFVVLNLYSMGFSPVIAANLLAHYFTKKVSEIDFGELIITGENGYPLPLSVYARF